MEFNIVYTIDGYVKIKIEDFNKLMKILNADKLLQEKKLNKDEKRKIFFEMNKIKNSHIMDSVLSLKNNSKK